MPVALQYGIIDALKGIAAAFPNVHFHHYGTEKRTSNQMEYIVYCCASELVANSVKHSGADTINLQLVQTENNLILTVSDNGCGYDKKTVIQGLGLPSMNNRVASFGGKIDIVTSPGKGTETIIEFKYKV
jgi:signal transduction histidine kinase